MACMNSNGREALCERSRGLLNFTEETKHRTHDKQLPGITSVRVLSPVASYPLPRLLPGEIFVSAIQYERARHRSWTQVRSMRVPNRESFASAADCLVTTLEN